jgi:superfamily I DNA/RNA helicase
MNFSERYAHLNERQRLAVDTIEGPVMVIAGPGTGKTELLSMRAANILQKTDTLPENILCLTFTESGATAMRERLSQIIGADAYKVAIHTFHSFGTEVINHNSEFFYGGANFKPADDLSCYEILRGIFDELDYDNPLAGKMGGEYTHLGDTLTVISELKKSGLTSDELLLVLDANDKVIAAAEPLLAEIFADRISKTIFDRLAGAAVHILKTEETLPLPGLPSLARVCADSLYLALEAATQDNSTKPITAQKRRDRRLRHESKASPGQATCRQLYLLPVSRPHGRGSAIRF